jgi:glyoxylase-like metal-dependent hydrolase (beta-lactamase superfamily II)
MTYVAYQGHDGIIIDPALDLDLSEMRLGRENLAPIVEFIKKQQLTIHWILETHVHADHVTGADVLKKDFPTARLAISEKVCDVQKVFKGIFGLKNDAFPEGWPFDRLLKDGDEIEAGELTFKVMTTPGHTPACLCYVNKEGVFTGDSIFMPKAGTGRCDFPGGDAKKLYESIQRIYSLEAETPIYVGHDYPPADQPPNFHTTVYQERRENIHVMAKTPLEEFVKFREARDKTLSLPKLFYPSLFLNMRGGKLPEKDSFEHRFIPIPLTASF